MQDSKPLFKIYSSTASQWAGVPLLGLVEKGYAKGSYEVENIDLRKYIPCVASYKTSWLTTGFPSTAQVGAGNFHPDYVKINPNGTIPSLTSPALPEALIDSTDILVYLNDSRPSGLDLSPKEDDHATSRRTKELIDLVHSPEVSTNIILLAARDAEELAAKQGSPFRAFLAARQDTLERYCAEFPDSAFYRSRRDTNGAIHKHYAAASSSSSSTNDSPALREFFERSRAEYRGFAAGVDRLEALLVLPYAAGPGPDPTLADLHIVPWLAHALWGAGSAQMDDFAPLEALLRKSVPGFHVGPRTRRWWANMVQRESVRKVYPRPH
ncbi:Glutathione S-transferase, domain-containing protein [Cladophialophora immunda]|nr:Glutathione S-transferase, domain-containing protein [Cladophialophora immunda]